MRVGDRTSEERAGVEVEWIVCTQNNSRVWVGLDVVDRFADELWHVLRSEVDEQFVGLQCLHLARQPGVADHAEARELQRQRTHQRR